MLQRDAYRNHKVALVWRTNDDNVLLASSVSTCATTRWRYCGERTTKMFYWVHQSILRNVQPQDGATVENERRYALLPSSTVVRERSRRSDEIGDAVLHDARKRQPIHGVIRFLHVLRDRQITQLLQRQIAARALADREFSLRRSRTDQREQLFVEVVETAECDAEILSVLREANRAFVEVEVHGDDRLFVVERLAVPPASASVPDGALVRQAPTVVVHAWKGSKWQRLNGLVRTDKPWCMWVGEWVS